MAVSSTHGNYSNSIGLGLNSADSRLMVNSPKNEDSVILMLFQICITFFPPWNTKKYIYFEEWLCCQFPYSEIMCCDQLQQASFE